MQYQILTFFKHFKKRVLGECMYTDQEEGLWEGMTNDEALFMKVTN